MDRRVARTRALLQQAHLSLITERGYDAVTVEAICQAANVGRSTFYAHYTDKEDLHRSGLEALRRRLIGHHSAALHEAGARQGDGLAFSLPMFEHARDHLDLYRALIGSRGGVVAMDAIRQMLCEIVRLELPRSDPRGEDPTPREFTVQFLVGAYLAAMTWWLDGGAQISPQAMDAAFRRIAVEGLASVGPSGAFGPRCGETDLPNIA